MKKSARPKVKLISEEVSSHIPTDWSPLFKSADNAGWDFCNETKKRAGRQPLDCMEVVPIPAHLLTKDRLYLNKDNDNTWRWHWQEPAENESETI